MWYGDAALVWEPFALAILLGLLVSAAIYFVVMWPQVEPDDPDDDEADAEPAGQPEEAPPGATGDGALSSGS